MDLANKRDAHLPGASATSAEWGPASLARSQVPGRDFLEKEKSVEKITRHSHPRVVAILLKAYPDYRGRLFTVHVQTQYRVWDFWDGGSRTYTAFVHLPTGRIAGSETIPQALRQTQGNWFNLPITGSFDLPGDVAVAEHRISCGVDRGLCLVLRPEAAASLLGLPAGAPEPPALAERSA